MNRLTVLLAAAGIACVPVRATDREFKDVVNAISEEFHARPMHIPFFGLVNFVTFVARPAGTKHIDLAVFEHLDAHDRDGLDVARSIQRSVGHAWKPFVRVISNKGGHQELVFVYMRPDGHDCKFLIATVEPDEATVVQLKLNPDALQHWLETPRMAATRHNLVSEHRSGADEDR
jgi:hypothetical protein